MKGWVGLGGFDLVIDQVIVLYHFDGMSWSGLLLLVRLVCCTAAVDSISPTNQPVA
jgi:hypothetical protein